MKNVGNLMNNRLIKIIFLLLLLSTMHSHAQESVRITNGEWLPYHSINLPHYGAGSRIVTEAFAIENINVEWGFFPWARAYQSVGNGKWDASVGWVKTRAREQGFLFSDPIYNGEWVFFHLKTTEFDWNNVDDLTDINIGATANYIYGDEFDQAEKQGLLSVQRVPQEQQSFGMLLKGRIQVFIYAKDGGYASLKAHFSPEQIQQITHHPKPVRVAAYHLLFAKNQKNKQLLTLFNKGLKRLQTSGKVDEYLNNARQPLSTKQK